MRIQFLKEDSSYYAVAQQQAFKGFMWEEMMFAEISPSLKAWAVKWEDDWSNPIHFDTLIEAQKHIEKEYFRHKPHSNGKKYEL